MKGLLIKANGISEIVEFPEKDKLGWYYETLGCDCIDIVAPYGVDEIAKKHDMRSIIGKFCLVVDDEGLLKDEPVVNPIASLMYGCDIHGQALFGDVLVGANLETVDGVETVGLTDNDMWLLQVSVNALIDQHNERVKSS